VNFDTDGKVFGTGAILGDWLPGKWKCKCKQRIHQGRRRTAEELMIYWGWGAVWTDVEVANRELVVGKMCWYQQNRKRHSHLQWWCYSMPALWNSLNYCNAMQVLSPATKYCHL